MTGHGKAQVHTDQVHVDAEIRAVNNRFLKTSINCELGASVQSQLESLVKSSVTRGSVNLKIKLQWLDRSSKYRLDLNAISAYREQLAELESAEAVDYSAILGLPGVVCETIDDDDNEAIWPAVQEAVVAALSKLNEMRAREGEAMATDLASNCDAIAERLVEIEKLAPGVIENYAKKMTDRINMLLEKHEISVDPTDIIREVGVFAERVDISEETVRLASHIQQFRGILAEKQSNGRKLDFLTQEMLRETNTIGSKANDARIASQVVEVKAVIERIREMVQNVE